MIGLMLAWVYYFSLKVLAQDKFEQKVCNSCFNEIIIIVSVQCFWKVDSINNIKMLYYCYSIDVNKTSTWKGNIICPFFVR